MQSEDKYRSVQDGLPPRQVDMPRFYIFVVKAVLVMLQMCHTNRVHAGQHENAQDRQNQIMPSSSYPQCMMLRVVGQPQTRQEKEK